jgi:DNA-binding NtrC family response regulator
MEERGIIIADRDAEYRNHVADFFRKAGYRVETTDSAVHVLCNILEKQTPVLLLGSDFDRKVSSADLVHLLKKCNRHLNVIMVSDEMPLALARKVRQEGIFYHALKPATAGDTEELGQAVACAFEKSRVSARTDPAPEEQQALGEPAGFSVERLLRALPWVAGFAALVFGTSYLSLAAVETVKNGGNVAIWAFLGFCALVVAAQLLPIFRIKLMLRWPEKRQAVREKAPRDENYKD